MADNINQPPVIIDIDDTFFNVPAVDAADNSMMADVLGNKSDTTAGTSVIALLKKIIASAGGDVDADLDEIIVTLALVQTAIGDPSADSLKSIVAKLGNDSATVKARFDSVMSTLAGLPFSVPTVDSVTNLNMRDVIGNKSDTSAGTSLLALIKAVKAKSDTIPTGPVGSSDIQVASANSLNNLTMRDVIGNKVDDETGTSMMSKLFIAMNHMHNVMKTYPTLANEITATCAAGVWALGAFVVVIPANTITEEFDIHQIHIGDYSANTTFQLQLYSGADGAEVLICQARFTRNSNTNPGSILPVVTPLIAANTQIKAKIACQAGGGATATFSVSYHIY